jgi:RNA polymerase sigma-70 factor (ECF subfamily)
MHDPRELYEMAIAEFGPALVRLAQAYERDPDRRQDLLQDIHFALWRSFAAFDQRCSLRTWTYRVAHNVASSHVLRDRRRRARPLVGLEALEHAPSHDEAPDEHLAGRLDAERRREQVVTLLERLAPPDRQLMLLYLEGLDAASISEVTGLSGANVATKVHRIKRVLAAQVRAAVTSSTTTGVTHER